MYKGQIDVQLSSLSPTEYSTGKSPSKEYSYTDIVRTLQKEREEPCCPHHRIWRRVLSFRHDYLIQTLISYTFCNKRFSVTILAQHEESVDTVDPDKQTASQHLETCHTPETTAPT